MGCLGDSYQTGQIQIGAIDTLWDVGWEFGKNSKRVNF
jgi:hypothetical protein